MATIEPAWAETTVRWLVSKGMIPAPSKHSTFSLLLRFALVDFKFLHADLVGIVGMSEGSWNANISKLASEWKEGNHRDFVSFVEAGGYHEACKRIPVTKAKEPVLVPVTDARGVIVGMGKIELELDDLEDAVEEPPGKKPQHSPDSELEEIMADALAQSDPRFGAW